MDWNGILLNDARDAQCLERVAENTEKCKLCVLEYACLFEISRRPQRLRSFHSQENHAHPRYYAILGANSFKYSKYT